MIRHRWFFLVGLALAVGIVWLRGGFIGRDAPDLSPAVRSTASSNGLATATFASGCFWCTEADFDKVAGVVSTTSGYIGGTTANPSYESVSSGRTGHAEAVAVIYDPAVVTYDRLLEHYWRNVDPFVAHRQFCDVGSQYRPAIFVHDDEQRALAQASKARVQGRFPDMPVLVAIEPAGTFYPAEAYHQDYSTKNSAQYRFYRYGCGRDARLQAIWGEADRN